MSQIKQGYKQTKVGVIPEDWEVVNLENVVSKSFYGTSKSTKEFGKYPVLRMGNMQGGRFEYSNLVYIDLSNDEFKKYKLEIGDIILNRTNSYDLVGKISLFSEEKDFLTASYLVTYRLKQNLINSYFLNFLLNTDSFQHRIKTFATKAVSQANINPTVFKKNLIIPLPPLNEQEKITKILTTWDKVIDLQEKLIKEKETYKLGLMQNLLTCKMRFEGFSGEWEDALFSEIFNNESGTPLEKFTQENASYKFISIGNYSKNGQYIDNKQRIVLNDKTKSKLLSKNNLVMVLNDKTATGDLIGSTILIQEDDLYIYNQRSEKIICHNNIIPKFAWYILNAQDFRNKVFSLSQGGTQIYINFSSIKKIKIKLPSLKEQQKISNFLSLTDKEIELQKNRLTELKNQKKTLMQNLLSGKMRVKV